MSDTKPIQKKVSFGKIAVQQLRRVAIPPLLAENMNIEEGDELAVYFDPDSKAAVLVKAETTDVSLDKSAKRVRRK